MSRKTLSIVVGLLGLVIALASLAGLMLMGSVLADARTENITGPGVDVFVRTRFPEPGSEIVLEVEARGGSRAGVQEITVRHGDQTLQQVRGDGATWGFVITSGKGRGSETMLVRVPVPDGIEAGQTLPLDLDVSYVVAMSSGAGSFENQTFHDTIHVDIDVLSSRGRLFARLRYAGMALGAFVVWFLLVWGVAGLYANAEDRERARPQPSTFDILLGKAKAPEAHDTEVEGIGLMMGLLGGGLVGYWVFARRLMDAWPTQATFWAVVFTAVWVLAPLAWLWRWWKRRSARRTQPPRAVALPPRG